MFGMFKGCLAMIVLGFALVIGGMHYMTSGSATAEPAMHVNNVDR